MWSSIFMFIVVWMKLVSATPSIVMTMICRDEDVNLKTNLAKWLPIVDYFVFVIDSRTIDESVSTIKRVLSHKQKQFKIIHNDFQGFGSSRTVSLTEAWNNFPQASHVLIADPDWVPDIDTMNINDLHNNAEVFRFTVFDRNGDTKRRMDWLLRHRQGLAMRYNLHEVLDIGTYSSVQYLGWIVHEIERPGSWHTTVGHGNSMSTKRHEFDLEMLNKDLIAYGHDPHTHYYLGITNQAIVQAAQQEGGLPLTTPTLQRSLLDALHYLQLRVNSQYKDEFVDERWACMYMLGITYANLQRDLTKSEYWLSMCRDYNPVQSECSIALAKIYLANGAFDPALRETEYVLRMQNEERDMLSHFKNYACELPELVLTLFQQKAYMGQLSTGEAMYMLLMLQMRKASVCDGHSKMELSREVRDAVERLLKEDVLTLDSPIGALCQDSGLLQFLQRTEFLLHPCEEFRAQLVAGSTCRIFNYNLPPANEEMQATSSAKEFVGAAQLLDVIHLVYGGDSRAVFRSDRPYSILFAEYFNPKAVYNLVGFFNRIEFSNYRIHVVTSDVSRITAMEELLAVCEKQLRVMEAPHVTFEHVELSSYLTATTNKVRQNASPASSTRFRFDYIEYSGGMSVDATHPEQMALLRELLTPEGVLGLTYFAKNHHVDKLRSFMQTKNTSALPPFSLETARLVRSYLDLNKMSFLKDDDALVTFLGGEPVKRKYSPAFLSDVVPSVDWRAFSQSEVLSAAGSANLRAVAWVPSAYAHPFDKLDHYEVKKFWAAGMTQEHFVENYMTFFRYSVYMQKGESNSAGRATVNMDTFLNQSVANNIQVLDRTGSLGSSFSEIWRRAEQRLSTSFAFAPYSIKGAFSLDYQALPSVSPCLAHLSSGATFWELHRVNVEFAEKQGQSVDEHALQDLLLHLLRYLENINVITYFSKSGPIGMQSATTVPVTPTSSTAAGKGNVRQVGGLKMRFGVTKKEEPVAEKTESNKQHNISSKKDTTVGQKEAAPLKVGGLNIRFKDKSSSRESSTQATTATQQGSVAHAVSVEKTQSEIMGRKGSLDVGRSSERQILSANLDQEKQTDQQQPSVVTPDASPSLSLDTQISRMKALGLSEVLIEETLRSARQSQTVSTRLSQTNVPSSSAPYEPVGAIKTKLRDILQILTTEEAAADGSSGPVVTASMDTTRLPETYEPTIAGGLLQNAKFARELKPKGADPQRFSSISQQAVPGVKTDLPSVERNALLGLKQRLLNSGSTTINGGNRASDNGFLQGVKSNIDSSGGISSKRRTESSVSASEIENIKVPATQSTEVLQSSFRRTECFYLSHERGPLPSNCVQTTPVKRRTAALNAMSLNKIDFDTAQLRHLVSSGVLANRAMANQLLTEYGRVREYFKTRQWTDKYKVARLTNGDMQVVKSIPALNRAVYISEDDADPRDLTYDGAITYLQSLATTAEADRSDFMVVDVVLKEEALRLMGTALLASTVWFDITNGICFVAHSDEGLVLPSMKVLAQQVGYALSLPGKKMRVVRYYAVAMSLDRTGGASPVAMGKAQETVVVVWLNPSTAARETDQQISSVDEDGLRIFDEYAASKLFAQGVSEYPSVHSEFLSRGGDLAVAMPPRSNQTASELVARKANRLVIIKGKRPFTFVVPSVKRDDVETSDSFTKGTMLAVVIVLSSP